MSSHTTSISVGEHWGQRFDTQNLLNVLKRCLPQFVPLPSTVKALREICCVQYTLQNAAKLRLSRPTVISGPPGVGMTFMLKSICESAFSSAVQATFPSTTSRGNSGGLQPKPITFFEYIDAKGCTDPSLETSTPIEVVLRRLVDRLHTDKQRIKTSQVLACMLEITVSAEQQGVSYGSYELIKALKAQPDLRNSAELKCIVESREIDFAGSISALLRNAQVAVMLVIDHADNFFRDDRFTYNAAAQWKAWLFHLASLGGSAFGCVMCSTYQRAEQLFFSDPKLHAFPAEFTHQRRLGGWSRLHAQHVRLKQPTWSCERLMHFMCVVYQETASESSEEGGALQAAKAHLERLLLSVSGEGAEGAEHQPALEASLEQFLREVGQSPKQVSQGVKSLLMEKSSCTWAALGAAASCSETQAPPKVAEGSLAAMSAYIHVLTTHYFCAHITSPMGFCADDYAVDAWLVMQTLSYMAQADHRPCPRCRGLRRFPAVVAMCVEDLPIQYIDAALEDGLLQYTAPCMLAVSDPSLVLKRTTPTKPRRQRVARSAPTRTYNLRKRGGQGPKSKQIDQCKRGRSRGTKRSR